MVAQFQSAAEMSAHSMSQQPFVPSDDVMTTIVIPTIVFCIGMVVAMLVGINKCKQWELDKIVEMRRSRRVIQRITARLREKNFRTIQKARHLRKRAVASVSDQANNNPSEQQPRRSSTRTTQHGSPHPVLGVPPKNPPPFYAPPHSGNLAGSAAPAAHVAYPAAGNSPPPAYEDSVLDQLYYECMPEKPRGKWK